MSELTGSFDVSPTEIPPSMQVPIEAQIVNEFTESPPPESPITDEMLSHLKANEIGGACGELLEIPSEPGTSEWEMIAALRECLDTRKWPDWVKWLNGIAKWMDVKTQMPARLAAIIDKAKWNQTPQMVTEEMYCRSRKVLVFQTDKNMVRSTDAGEVLVYGPRP